MSANTKTPPAPSGRLTGRGDPAVGGVPTWSTFGHEAAESVPPLLWPASIDTNDQMGKEAQVSSLLRLLKGPIRNYRMTVDPGNMPPERVEQPASRLGMTVSPDADDEQIDPRNGLGERSQILRDALRAPTIGHSVMEIVGEDRQDGWDLLDLAYLSPRSLSRWVFVPGRVDVDYIEQLTGSKPVKLPAYRLVILRWELDPDMPYGESMLRPLYPHWVRKDRLLRTDLVAAQRNGMGVPFWQQPENAVAGQSTDYERLVTGVAAGEDTGLTGQGNFSIQGVTGKTYDILASIRYDDEQMARTLGGQIQQLGQTQTGSRALGESMADLLWDARDALVEWVAQGLTTQVMHRWAVWNGADPASDDLPRITWARPQTVEPLTAQDWAVLREAGLIDDSPETRAEFARRYRLPAQREGSSGDEGSGSASGDAGPPPIAASMAVAAARDTGLVPGVPQATRQLHEWEDTSRYPFARIQTAWAAARDTLVGLWRRVRTDMIGRATDAVSALEDLEQHLDELHDLTRDAAAGAVTDRVLERAATVTAGLADDAAAHVRDAAKAQGVTLTPADVDYHPVGVRDAKVTAQSLATGVSDQVARRAVNLAGPDASAATVASEIATDLDTLTDANLERLAGAQATRAQAHGQAAQTEVAETEGAVRSIYYSALLDGNTCGPCAARDGHQYADMGEVREDFPSGGYRLCEGGPACRCTWVTVMGDETPATVVDA